jgi:hypothetical protein
MRALFRDKRVQERFEADGCAVIPFLGRHQVDELLDFYRSLDHGEISDSLYVSSNTARGAAFVRAVRDRIQQVVAEPLRENFDDCRVITGSFLVKKPNPKNRILPHQDWTTVDDERYACASVWTALTDIGRDKGPLGTIDGSHRFFRQVLCSPSAHSYRKLPYAQHLAALFPYLRFHPVKAGEAVVFDSRVIHGSLPNTTSELRMAASVGIVPREAALYHHYLLPGTGLSKFETYEVDEDFFVNYSNVTLTALHDEGGKPEGLKSLGVFDLARFSVEPVGAAQMAGMVEAAGNVLDPSLAGVEAGAIFGRG